MNDSTTHATGATKGFAGHDLSIKVWPDTSVKFVGTAAQLRDEGLIPAGFEFPDKFRAAHWERNGWRFCLWRVRPEGAKGPRRDFMEVDCWHLNRSVAEQYGRRDYGVQQKTRELAEAIAQSTPDGIAARCRLISRVAEASRDKRYQGFKALLMGAPVRSTQAH